MQGAQTYSVIYLCIYIRHVCVCNFIGRSFAGICLRMSLMNSVGTDGTHQKSEAENQN